MEHVRLGRSGLQVSRLCLGTMTFGLQSDEATAIAIMDRAADAGVDFLDSSDAYPLGGDLASRGRTEEIIGRWLRGKRDRFIIATKCFAPVGPAPFDAGNSRKHIMSAVEGSLRRLGTDYIDLYQLHGYDPDTPIDETLGALDDLVHQGKVRYVGASNTEAWRLTKSLWVSDRLGLVRYDGVQNEYNLLNLAIEAEVLPLAADQDLAVTPFSPMAGGLLTGKYALGRDHPAGSRLTLRPGPYAGLLTAETFRAIEALRAQAADRGVSPGALALAWVLANPAVTAALIGPRSLEQFQPALEAVPIGLTAADRDRIADRMEAARAS